MVIIYGRPNCRHCEVVQNAAFESDLLVDYRDLTQEKHEIERVLFKMAGFKTVPQVFYVASPDDAPRLIGGCAEFLEFLKQRQKEM